MTCPHARRLGVVALGVEDRNQASFDRHLTTCNACQAELSELASVVPLLAAVERADIASLGEQSAAQPPDELLDRVLATISTERCTMRSRRRRRRLALAAAAAVLIAAGSTTGAMMAFQSSNDPPNRSTAGSIELAAGRSSLGVSADTSIRPQAWGTRIDMTLAGLPPNLSCRLIARADSGRTETAASWRVNYQDSLDVEGMTSLSSEDLAELEVVDSTGRALITVPVRTSR